MNAFRAPLDVAFEIMHKELSHEEKIRKLQCALRSIKESRRWPIRRSANFTGHVCLIRLTPKCRHICGATSSCLATTGERECTHWEAVSGSYCDGATLLLVLATDSTR